MTPQDLTSMRKSLGLTKTELAKLLGLARQTISTYEHGHAALPRWLEWAMIGLHVRAQAPTAGRGDIATGP